MAKTRRARKTKLTTKPIVKHIDGHVKQLRKMKAGATPQQKKQLQRHIVKLTRIRKMAMDACDGYYLLS